MVGIIELFSRVPDGIQLPEDVHHVHIDVNDEYLSGFSAILMDDDYYYYAITNSHEMDGLQVLDKKDDTYTTVANSLLIC